MKLIGVALAFAALLGFPGAAEPPARYAEGQVWEYKTRPSDEGSLLKIQKIENLAAFASSGPVYHISIIGVHLQGAPLSREIQHVPVSRETLDASVTRLSNSSAAFPDPSAGIEEWRAAKGGVFTISAADIVTTIEQTVRGHSSM